MKKETEDVCFIIFACILIAFLIFIMGVQVGKWDERQRVEIEKQIN